METHPVLQESEMIARHGEQGRMKRRASRRQSMFNRDMELEASAQKLDPNKRRNDLGASTKKENLRQENRRPLKDAERRETKSKRTPAPPRSVGSMLHPPGEKEQPKMDQRAGGLPNLASPRGDSEDEATPTASSTASTPRPTAGSRKGSLESHRASAARLSVPTLDLSSIRGDPRKASSNAAVESGHVKAKGISASSQRVAKSKGSSNATSESSHGDAQGGQCAISMPAPEQKLSGLTPNGYTPKGYTPKGHTSDRFEPNSRSYQVTEASGGCGDLQAGLENLADELRMNRPSKLGICSAPNVLEELRDVEKDDMRRVKSYLSGPWQPPQPLDPPVSSTTHETPLGDGFCLMTEVLQYADGQKRRGSTWLKVEGEPPVMLERVTDGDHERKWHGDGGHSHSALPNWRFGNDTARKGVSNCSTLELLARATSIDDISLRIQVPRKDPSPAQRHPVDSHVQLHNTLSNMAAKLASDKLRSSPEDPWVMGEHLRMERDAWRHESDKLRTQAFELQQKLVCAQQEARYWHQHPSARPYHNVKGFGQDTHSVRNSMSIKSGQMEEAQAAEALRQCLKKVQNLKEELVGNFLDNDHYPEAEHEFGTNATDGRQALGYAHFTDGSRALGHFPAMGGSVS